MVDLNSILSYAQSHPEAVGVCMMPITYGFVGWFTNIVAIKMTFFPLKFMGIPPYLGWQGIIPRKAQKMASYSVDIITDRLIKLEEVVKKIDPKQVHKELNPIFQETIKEVLKDVVDEINPSLWNLLPQKVKKEMYLNTKKESRTSIQNIIKDMQKNIYKIFDLKALVLRNLVGKNVKVMVDMFQTVGGKEFRFIEMSGLWFGFLFGSLQMIFWYLFPLWWTLPIQGVIVGYITNWLALKMIFRPLYRKKFVFFHYQGLFLKRQDEVAKSYANIIASKILTSEKIMEEILYGRAADQALGMIRKTIIKAVEASTQKVKPVLSYTFSSKQYERIKLFIISKMTSLIPKSTRKLHSYVDKTMNIEKTLYEKMKKLPPEDFEIILRSAFQEDEILLILVGATLGAIVGMAQAFYMFFL